MDYIRSAVICTICILFNWCGSFAATYYVDPSSPNDTGSGSEVSPKKYISSGISLMHSGDTLVLEDGTYTGAANMMRTDGESGYGGSGFPPSGISRSNFTTVRARNIGMAIIDGEYAMTPFSNANLNIPSSYIHIDGIHFKRGAGANDPTGSGVFAIAGSYMWVTNCGFEDGVPPSDLTVQAPIAYISGGSDHVLIEDCWAWGKGRYGMYFQSSNGGVTNSIFRRCVIRQDDATRGPTAGIMFYDSRGNAVQNCIVVDSRVSHSPSDTYGAFSLTANDGLGIGNNNISGSIALNNINYAGFVPQTSIENDVITVKNTVFWANGESYFTDNGFPHGVMITSTDRGTFNFDHVVSGANKGSGFRSNSSYLGKINVTNSIAVNNGMYGFADIDIADHVDSYGNTLASTTGTTITNGLTLNPLTDSLKYLTRIESASPLKETASDGGDIGATIINQIGGSGTFYGDSGWNTESSTHLWPFQNESIWAAKMKAYSAAGPGGNRGFAALSGATDSPLTEYIWGFLGNVIPSPLYPSMAMHSTSFRIPGGVPYGIVQ